MRSKLPRAVPVVLAILLAASSVAARDAKVVTFKTSDRLTITGDLWTAGRRGAPAVIALHMYPSDRTSWRPMVRILEDKGIDLLAIDMRGYGESARQGRKDLSGDVRERKAKLFRNMHRDALAAYAFLVERGADPDRIAFLGASVGCSVAIDAAAREPRIRGAVVMTPGTNYLGVETMKHLKGYGARPLLILSSREEAGKGADAIGKALGKTAEVRLVDQTGVHGTFMFGKVPEIESRIASWLGDLLAAGICLDGQVSSEEASGGNFGEWDLMEEGKARLTLKVVGRWIYAGIRADPPGEGPAHRFTLAWAPGGEADGAHRLAGVFERRGSRFTLEVQKKGRWKPVPKAFPKGTRLGASSTRAAELLIPRSFPGLADDTRLKVSFGFANRSGIMLAILPTYDHDMTQIEKWLDFGL